MVGRADGDGIDVVAGQQLVERAAEGRDAQAPTLFPPLGLVHVPHRHHLGARVFLVATDMALARVAAATQYADPDLAITSAHVVFLSILSAVHPPDRCRQSLRPALDLVVRHLDQAHCHQARDELFGHGAKAGLVAIAAVLGVQRAAHGAIGRAEGRRDLENVVGVSGRLREAKAEAQALFLADPLEVVECEAVLVALPDAGPDVPDVVGLRGRAPSLEPAAPADRLVHHQPAPRILLDIAAHARHLAQPNGGRHLVHAEVERHEGGRFAAEGPFAVDALVQVTAVGDDHGAVPRGQVLALLEAEDAQVSPGAGVPALPGSAHRVRAVLDQEEVVLLADGGNLVHLGALAPHVRDDDSLAARADVGAQGGRIHKESVVLDVDKAWHGVEVEAGQPAEVHDGVAQHLPTGARAADRDRLGQAGHGRVAADGVFGAHQFGKGLLEAGDHAAILPAQATAGQNLFDVAQL